jgi:hypothetical protein
MLALNVLLAWRLRFFVPKKQKTVQSKAETEYYCSLYSLAVSLERPQAVYKSTLKSFFVNV